MTAELFTKVDRMNLDPGDPILAQMERLAWRWYAAERWAVGKFREEKVRAQFVEWIRRDWDRLRKSAKRAGGSLDFGEIHLRLIALRALDASCVYCGESFGLDDAAIVFDLLPSPLVDAFRRANVVCCCGLCARAKGEFNGRVWLDVLAALRAAGPDAKRAGEDALARGWATRAGAPPRGSS